jgi:hypothetical protein
MCCVLLWDFSTQRSIYHRQEFGSLPGILFVAFGLNAVEQPLIVVMLKGILERLRAVPPFIFHIFTCFRSEPAANRGLCSDHLLPLCNTKNRKQRENRANKANKIVF